jgi:hypothetical protein
MRVRLSGRFGISHSGSAYLHGGRGSRNRHKKGVKLHITILSTFDSILFVAYINMQFAFF